MKHRYLFVIALVCAVAVGNACNKPNENARVHVEYEQLANFAVFKLDPNSNSTTGAADGMFILYKITKITNTGSEANNFTFDKHKVVAVTPDKSSNEEPSGDNILLGSKFLSTLSVPAGQTKNNPQPGCFIKHVLTSNPQSLANTGALVELIYQIDTSGAQPVSMKRVAGDDSTALVSDAHPSVLQSFCP